MHQAIHFIIYLAFNFIHFQSAQRPLPLPEIWARFPEFSNSVSPSEDMLDGFRSSLKCSFHWKKVSTIRVNGSPPLLNTARALLFKNTWEIIYLNWHWCSQCSGGAGKQGWGDICLDYLAAPAATKTHIYRRELWLTLIEDIIDDMNLLTEYRE